MQKCRILFALLGSLTSASESWAQSISSTQPLVFGSFVAGTGGTITIGTAGERSKDGGVILVPSGSGSAATFNVTGNASATYAISLPADGVVALASGANTMGVNNFNSNPASTGQLSIGGSQTVTVGARLSVSSNQAPGTYSGSFTVTVNYN